MPPKSWLSTFQAVGCGKEPSVLTPETASWGFSSLFYLYILMKGRKILNFVLQFICYIY